MIAAAAAIALLAAGQSVDAGFTPAMDPSAIAHGILVSNIPRQSVEAARTRPPSSYRPSAAVTDRVADTLSEEMERRTRGAGAEMRKVVISGQAAREYRQVAGKLGFSATDAADALAFYMVAQWGVATDYREMVTRAQMDAVRRQVRGRYAGIAGQLDTDAKRQEFAEILSMQGVVVAGIHEAAVAAGDESRVAEIVGMARQGGRTLFGADPAGFALTEAGLVPRR